IMKLHQSPDRLSENLWFLGVCDHDRSFKHISNTGTRNSSTGDEDKQHGKMHKGEKYLHRILHEGNQITNLKRALSNEACSDRNDQYLPTQHDQVHQWENKRHCPADEDLVVGDIQVGFIKTVFFITLFVKCSDDQHAR